jgi:hypothetical protein
MHLRHSYHTWIGTIVSLLPLSLLSPSHPQLLIATMVYLSRVKKDDEVFDLSTRKVDSIDNGFDENGFSTNVYGSHFATDHLPLHEMPEHEMPRQIASRMVTDELSLDANPRLKYALSLISC